MATRCLKCGGVKSDAPKGPGLLNLGALKDAPKPSITAASTPLAVTPEKSAGVADSPSFDVLADALRAARKK